MLKKNVLDGVLKESTKHAKTCTSAYVKVSKHDKIASKAQINLSAIGVWEIIKLLKISMSLSYVTGATQFLKFCSSGFI